MQKIDPVTLPPEDTIRPTMEQMAEMAERLKPPPGSPLYPQRVVEKAPADGPTVDRNDEMPPTPRWGVVPTPKEFQPFIRGALAAVFVRVVVAGLRYGEEVLFVGGELVSAAQVFTDSCRILYGVKENERAESDRDDSWLDLAGYALIEIARRAYERGDQPGDIDGLFDR